MARTPELIEGNKSFQPDPELNLQMNIRVVCVPETADGQVSIGFVTALQDRYTLKKSANSASLGVGAVHWDVLLNKVLIPLVLSPAAGFVIALGLMKLLYMLFSNMSPHQVGHWFRRAQVVSAFSLRAVVG